MSRRVNMNTTLRKIINIDADKCTGCGNCVPGCPEGALQMIDGKARLVSDLFCDGLGACIGECPEGAIKIEEREAEPYSEAMVMENIVKQGSNTIKAHLHHLKEHNESEYLNQAIDYLKKNGYNSSDYHPHGEELPVMKCGCPSSMERDMRNKPVKNTFSAKISLNSELSQWPIQLHLINPGAGYLKNADLLLAADCVPFAYPDFHRKFLKGKILIILCPKLDEGIDEYISKLADIFANQDVRSVTIAHMEVPCCFGVEKIVRSALQKANKNIQITD
jgi:ferredoxin